MQSFFGNLENLGKKNFAPPLIELLFKFLKTQSSKTKFQNGLFLFLKNPTRINLEKVKWCAVKKISPQFPRPGVFTKKIKLGGKINNAFVLFFHPIN